MILYDSGYTGSGYCILTVAKKIYFKNHKLIMAAMIHTQKNKVEERFFQEQTTGRLYCLYWATVRVIPG